jgi:alkaline phosphatase D
LGIDDTTGDTWSFVAPAKFLGDKESAYGGTLSYDIKISDSDGLYPWKYPDVGLTGGGISISWYELSSPNVGVWTSRNISLEPAEWWKSDNTNPTIAEMKQVLGNLTGLFIRAEYKGGPDYAYLDNVVLTPEPATVALLGLGALSLLRRKK